MNKDVSSELKKEYDKMNISQKEYSSMVDRASPKSRLFRDCAYAFLSGGFICITGQALTDNYGSFGAVTDSHDGISYIYAFNSVNGQTSKGDFDVYTVSVGK